MFFWMPQMYNRPLAMLNRVGACANPRAYVKTDTQQGALCIYILASISK